MTTEDVIMLGVVGPAVLIPVWVVVLRIWRQGRDVYDQAVVVKWMTPESARHGYHAFALPGVLSFTVMWLVTAVKVVWESGGGPPWVGDAVTWGYLLGVGLILLAWWLWAFMWPRFLVPPHLRGQRGWAVAALRGTSDGDRAESAAEKPHR
jgi:hypothetical protein